MSLQIHRCESCGQLASVEPLTIFANVCESCGGDLLPIPDEIQNLPF